jgi:O-antigen/teichoic acid export membrane protein
VTATISRDLKSSTTLLIGANVVSAAVGALQGVLVLRILGTELFGAAAVLIALTSIAANFVDVRLHDLISKLYYDERAACPETGLAYRARALRLVLGLYAAGACIIAAAGSALLWLLADRLTDVELSMSSLVLAAAAQGITYLGSFFIFVQRFELSPRRMAVAQLASAAVNAIAMVGLVSWRPTLGGYATGLALSAAGVAVLNGWQAVAMLRRCGVALAGRVHSAAPALDYRAMLRFIAAGNFLGYVKLLHRAADVAVVAVFCGDADTAIYKLARSMTDALQAISEAIGRIYQPRLLVLLQRNEHVEYRAIARWLVAAAGAVTAVAIAAELIVLPTAAPWLGVGNPHVFTVAVAILTVAFFLGAGVQSWISPLFIFSARLGRYAGWALLGVAAQHTIGPGLVYLTGRPSPTWFAVGYVSFYVVSLLPLLHELRQDRAIGWRAEEAPAS